MAGLRWAGLLLILSLSGCDEPHSNYTSTINFAVSGKPTVLHPVLASDALSERITALLYGPLVKFNKRQEAIPGQIMWAATSPTEYMLTLRPQLPPFTNGQLPTATDVVATLKAAQALPGSGFSGALQHIEQITLIDEHRVRVSLSRPDPRFAEKLHIGLLPASQASTPETLARKPLGNGAFAFISWMDNGVRLRRRKDAQDFVFEAVADPTMRALKLIRGESQIAQNDLPGEIADYLAQRPELSRETVPGATFSYLGFNLTDPLTGDLRVRQAIAYGIDRAAITHALFKDQATPTETLLTSNHWAAATDLPAYTYQPDKARALLATLGFSREHPLVISYKTSTDPFRLRIAAVLQAQLADVGIALQIQSYEWGTFFGDIKAGRFQMYSLSWVGIHSPDIFRHIYHSASMPPQGANRGRYRSARMDALIEQAERLPVTQATERYHAIQQLAHETLIYVPLWHENQQLLTRGLTGSKPDALGSYQFLEQVSLAHE